MLGLVLAGGGARGAYEAGVLRFLFDDLAARVGRPFRPDVLTGTSIGALACAMVGGGEREGAMALSRLFRELAPEHVYDLGPFDLLSLPAKVLGRHDVGDPGGAVLDPTPLVRMVSDEIAWGRLRERLDRRELHALVVSSTLVADGQCVQFVDGAPVTRTTPTVRMVPTRIDPQHLLGSAAIPFVFPPVEIDGQWHVDGSLRQNTPLQPAIHLGANRILVVGVQRGPSAARVPAPTRAPTPLFLAGKALNAVMLDPIEEDLRRTETMNQLLAWAEGAYPGFGERLRAEHRPFRQIQLVHVRPSADLGHLAALLFNRCKGTLPFATRRLLDAIAGAEGPEEADLLSYLLFDRCYTAEVEELGWRDARAQEEELATLWGPLTAPA